MNYAKSLFLALSLALSNLALAAPVNINTADAQTLAAEINGVGEKYAQAIVAYRTANGPFQNADDLAKVRGIGPKVIEKNRDNLLVK